MRAKVFHVITKLDLGGAQKVTLMTLERLPRDRYELGLVASPEGLLVEWANRIPGLKCVWISSIVRQVRPVQDALAFVRLWRLFRRERPAIVHTHTAKAGILGRWAAKLAGVPYIFHTSHGFGFNDFQRPIERNFYIGLERLTAKITTKLFMVSYANAETAEKIGMARRGEWILSRDAIAVEEFMESKPRRQKLQEWGIPGDRIIVGMVACFKPQKSPEDFIEVAARVLKKTQRAHFVMAGDGDLRPSVEVVFDNTTSVKRSRCSDGNAKMKCPNSTAIWTSWFSHPCGKACPVCSPRPWHAGSLSWRRTWMERGRP